MKLWCALVLVIVLPAAAGSGGSASGAVASFERKLQRIESNGASRHSQPSRTQFSEEEINSYFAAGRVDLPEGVQSLKFRCEPGIVTANTRVDFEKLKAGRGDYNPLLEIFSGMHDIVAVAHAHGSGGVGRVQIDSVSLDGVNIPRFALQLFVEKYIQPKYAGLGLESRFNLPDGIDSAIVGAHELIVTQK